MRTHPWRVLLLALSLLSNACAPLTPPPGRGMSLRYTPHEALGPALATGPSDESPPPSPSSLSTLAAHLAFLGAVGEVSTSTRRISGELSRLRASRLGIAGAVNGIFVSYLEYGEGQRRWIEAELAAATRLATAASQVEAADMQLALLRLAGPRLEAAMMGSLLLAVWCDFLHRTDIVLTRHSYGVERLYVDMEGFQKKVEPAMTALSSLEQSSHQAIHGGGNWKLGRTWPGEWNRMIMEALRKAETKVGRTLTRNEVLEIVAERMQEYRIPMNFIRWRGR